MKKTLFLGLAIFMGFLVSRATLDFLSLTSGIANDFFRTFIAEHKTEKLMASTEDSFSNSKESEEFEKKIAKKDRQINFKQNGFNFINSEKNAPKISADRFAISDLVSGEILNLPGQDFIQEDSKRNQVVPIASITKLMTAVVVWENYKKTDNVTISWESQATYGSQGNLSAGNILSVYDLMNVLLLTSSNDAAESLARDHVLSRSDFMNLMNQKATEIGMTKTFYDDPSGLSDKNVSTLNDLVVLTNYLNKNYPEILEITHQKSYSSKGRTWFNNSKFRNDKNYHAGKNGYTNEARQTLVSIFELPIGSENEKRLINFIVLGSDTAEQDVRDLVLYTLQNIEYVSN